MSASCTKQPPHTIEAYSWVGLINVNYDLEKCSLPILSLNFLKSYFFLYLEFTIPSMSSDQLRFCDNKWRWVGRNSTLSPWKNNLGKTELCFLVKKTTSYVHTFTTQSLCFSLYISLFPSFTHNNLTMARYSDMHWTSVDRGLWLLLNTSMQCPHVRPFVFFCQYTCCDSKNQIMLNITL